CTSGDSVMDKKASQERVGSSANGFVYVAVGVLLVIAPALLLLGRPTLATVGLFAVGMVGAVWCLTGLYMLQPNQAALLLLFGSYRGSDRSEGLRWANPFYSKKKVSVRARNFN